MCWEILHVWYLCVWVSVTLCMQAAALPTGIRSLRHIFTSSTFKGINIALAMVAGLNGWLRGREGGWMSNAISQLLLPSFLYALIRFDKRSAGQTGCIWASTETICRSNIISMCSLVERNIWSFMICRYISWRRSFHIHLCCCIIQQKRGEIKTRPWNVSHYFNKPESNYFLFFFCVFQD